MSESNHTPGPWLLKDGDFHTLDMIVTTQDRIDDPHSPICELDVDYDGEHGIEQKANAALIAAAPDLLSALVVVVNDWTAQFERQGHMAPAWCKQARDAIAKATS